MKFNWRAPIIAPSHVKDFWRKSQNDLVFTQATALAYTTIISLVPVLAVAFFLFKAMGGLDNLISNLEPLIEQNLAPSFGNQISTYLDNFLSNVHAGAVGILGAVGFIFTSISTLATIEKTFNMIWGVRIHRSIGNRITTYWSMLTIGPVLFGLSVWISTKTLAWLKSDNGAISHGLIIGFTAVPYLLSGLMFSALFFFMPNTAVNKRDALKAGFLTGIVFETAKILYAAYATRSVTNSAVYGSLAVIPVFLLWLYVVWLIILFGAELCCYYQFMRLKIPYKFLNEDRLNSFLLVDLLELLEQHQNPKGGLTMSQIIGELKVSLFEAGSHVDFLCEQGVVVSSGGDFISARRYHLAVPREKIQMRELLGKLEERRYMPRSKTAISVHQKLKQLWIEWSEG